MLKQYSLNVIGCGKLGQTIAFLLKAHLKINCILNRSLQSSQAAVKFIGAGIAIGKYSELIPADLYLIATNDSQVSSACAQLYKLNILKPGDIIFHCSGLLSSDILAIAHQAGARLASIHPARSFANPKYTINEFAGTYCALEGDIPAVKLLTTLFQAIGAHTFKIDKESKVLYHAASCIASNYLVTLSSMANSCFYQAGIGAAIANQLTNNLMGGTLENLKNLNHQEALTGPIARGDFLTIEQHIEHLPENLKAIYSLLGKQTLNLTSHDNQEKILRALENSSFTYPPKIPG